MRPYLSLLLAILTATTTCAQLTPIPAFPLNQEEDQSPTQVLRQKVSTGQPFTVAGPQGVLVGEQQGLFEAWTLPVKLLSHFTLEAQVEGYPVPIDLNAAAREIEVRPDRTTITYSHIAVTVRQIMFSPDAMPPGTGAIVLFAIDSVRPVDLTFRFTGELREMWPKLSSGTPAAEWVERGTSGFYILHSDYPTFAGAIALPGAKSGIMAPYQERPQVHPLELKLHADPKQDRNKFFPLLMAVGRTAETATTAALEKSLQAINANLPALYAAHAARYKAQAETLTSINTPDIALNQDFSWAVTSIGQLRAKAQPTGEIGLVAGYYASGDSARPGFGWFFGRDSLYTLYAVNSYGDFALARAELTFLMNRQRADGKVMHEYSQTAADLDWAAFPYWYAAADATPLFLTTMLDYVRASGDVAFLESHKGKVLAAWQFETTHDQDHDGIYDNAQGTGWVESWPPGMPKQEIYLALFDQQASAAMGQLAKLLHEETIAAQATTRAARLHTLIEHEYLPAKAAEYAFSQNNGTLDHTQTIYPSVAWWNAGPGYTPGLDHPVSSLKHWSSHDFATDWGARDVAASDPMYDPISYHQGSVWPLFTGWAALAQYRSGHPLAGYQSAMQNADLTHTQDIGAVTELLSGDFFEPFGRSTSQQLWSSAMVVTPILRGLFGIEVDALTHTLKTTPHLPADWPTAEVHHLHIGSSVVDLHYRRDYATLQVSLTQVSGPPITLITPTTISLPAVEVSLPHALPQPGSRTAQLKVLNETRTPNSLTLELEAPGGTTLRLPLHQNQPTPHLTAEGATLQPNTLTVTFPPAPDYIQQKITLRW